MTNRESSFSSGAASSSARAENQSSAASMAQDMRSKAADAASKVADAAQQAGSQAKETAASLASDAAQQAKGLLNMQVTAGADLASNLAESVHCAADKLDQSSPQLAGLVRGAAERVEEFSRDIRGQTVEDVLRNASDFTRRQPALMFGLASLAGFLAFRVLKSSPPAQSHQGGPRDPFQHKRIGQFHGA
jgi:hypothetical protein